MKPTSVLINVGRGPLVDERALYEALRDRTISAAAIDVWYRYPSGEQLTAPTEHPLAGLDNVVMTPHASGLTYETIIARIDDITENIRRLSNGEALENVVTVT